MRGFVGGRVVGWGGKGRLVEAGGGGGGFRS